MSSISLVRFGLRAPEPPEEVEGDVSCVVGLGGTKTLAVDVRSLVLIRFGVSEVEKSGIESAAQR